MPKYEVYKGVVNGVSRGGVVEVSAKAAPALIKKGFINPIKSDNKVKKEVTKKDVAKKEDK